MSINIKILHELEALEERIQTAKWDVGASTRRPQKASTAGIGIAAKTSAILTKHFTPGVTYEDRIRRGWKRRLHRG